MLSVRKKTKNLFLKYSMGPVIMFSLIVMVLFVVLLKYSIMSETKNSRNNLSSELTVIYQEYTKAANKFAQSDELIHFLETREQSNLVYEEFYNFNGSQRVKSNFYLVQEDGMFLADTNKLEDVLGQKSIFKIITRMSKNKTDFLVDVNNYKTPQGLRANLLFIKKIKTKKQAGYLIFELAEKDLADLLYDKSVDMVAITDEYDYLLATNNSILRDPLNKLSLQVERGNSFYDIGDVRYYLATSENVMGKFNIYTLKRWQLEKTIVILSITFFSILTAVILLIFYYSSGKMANQSSHSIHQLIESLENVKEGDLSSRVTIQTNDEFELLANRYNLMLDELNQSIKANQELSEIKRIDEIKFLQSQFNPHFLFNMLETLRYLIKENLEESESLIIVLSRLLRYGIEDNIDVNFLTSDLAYIVDYLKLQQYRFSERLEFEIIKECPIESVIVPKLILQPIVENSIKYGYQSRTHLDIKIFIKKIENQLHLVVVDNGPGIESDILEKIKKDLDHGVRNGKNLGLYNVNKRIKLMHGTKCGVSIQSILGQNTIVTVKLPYDVKSEEG